MEKFEKNGNYTYYLPGIADNQDVKQIDEIK